MNEKGIHAAAAVAVFAALHTRPRHPNDGELGAEEAFIAIRAADTLATAYVLAMAAREEERPIVTERRDPETGAVTRTSTPRKTRAKPTDP